MFHQLKKILLLNFIRVFSLLFLLSPSGPVYAYTEFRVSPVADHAINLSTAYNGEVLGFDIMNVLSSTDISLNDKNIRILLYIDFSQSNMRKAPIKGGCTTAIPGLAVRFHDSQKNVIDGDCQTAFYYYVDDILYKDQNFKTVGNSYFDFIIYDVNALPKQGNYNAGINFGLRYMRFSVDPGLWPMQIRMIGGSMSPEFRIFGTPKITNRIIFPDYPNKAPSLPINLSVSGHTYAGMTATGKARINMCLDDGNGINSSQYQLSITDTSTSPGTGQDFNLVNQQGKDTERDHIHYRISIQDPKTLQQQAITMGNPVIWSNVNKDNSKTRNVVIDGKSITCTDTPLSIRIPRFNYNQKRGGHFQGEFTVLFTPTLNN